MTFTPGQSGNPHGRKAGSRSKSLVLLDRIGQDAAGDVLRSVIGRAKAGDVECARLLLSRAWPPRKGRAVTFDLPEIRTPADLVAAIASVGRQASQGALSLEEATMVTEILTAQVKAIEVQQLAADVRALKERIGL